MKHNSKYTLRLTNYERLLSLALTLVLASNLFAQKTETESKKETQEQFTEGPFVNYETPPEFPGGTKALMEYIKNEKIYPQEAIEKGVEGSIMTTYTVEADGSLTEIEIIKGVDPLLDQEALRIIKTMPKWKPGMQKNQAVRVRFRLPIVFDLNEHQKESANDDSIANNDDEVYTEVDEKPEFQGGVDKLMSFLARNIKYPKEAMRKGIQGRVITNFIVNKDGTISNIVVKEGVNKQLDAEAIRVLSKMPKWKPGKNNGEIVRVNFTLPVTFRVESSSMR